VAQNNTDAVRTVLGGLDHAAGSSEISLTTKRVSNETVSFVYGILLLRDGQYDSIHNSRFWLDGVQRIDVLEASADVMLRATAIR
jgi:hypothetical protein